MARWLYTEKFTPSAVTVGPIGAELPGCDSRRSGPDASRCERRHHVAQSPTLACIIPPSTT